MAVDDEAMRVFEQWKQSDSVLFSGGVWRSTATPCREKFSGDPKICRRKFLLINHSHQSIIEGQIQDGVLLV